MSHQSFTLIVVPHAKARFRKIQVPVRLAKWTDAVCVVGGRVVSAMLAHYFWIKVEVDELKRLRVQNESLQQKARTYEQNVGKLQEKVISLQKTVDKLGVMAGLDQVPPSESAKIAGVGGAASSESTAPSLDPGFSLRTMERDVQDLAQRSEKLESFYKDQKILLASTPSIWPVRGYLSSRFGNRLDPFT